MIPPTPPPSPPALRWLLRLLQSAPVLRFLSLGMEMKESELPLFSSLTTLRGFRLLWSRNPWRQRFSHSKRSHRLPQPDLTDWLPALTAPSSLESLRRQQVEREGGHEGQDSALEDGTRAQRETSCAVLRSTLLRLSVCSCGSGMKTAQRKRSLPPVLVSRSP
jgi:hypothetical protein